MASDADRQLCNAARVGSVTDIDRLVAAGADPNAFLGRFNYSPLLTAAREGRCDAAAALLRAGALVDGSHADGLTALMVAATFGHTTMVDALLGAGADASRACDNGDTSLHFSCRRRHHDTVKALLEAGARTDVRNSRGRRPFQVVRACRVVACGRT
jgi:ankyrin repeat protein